jgi:hypothetical protein
LAPQRGRHFISLSAFSWKVAPFGATGIRLDAISTRSCWRGHA